MVETAPMFSLGVQEMLILTLAGVFIAVVVAVAYNVMQGKDDNKD